MSLAQKSFVTAAVAPFLLAFGLAASNANAAPPAVGQCAPADVVKTEMINAGYLPLVAYDRSVIKNNGDILTRRDSIWSSPNLSNGYFIRRDGNGNMCADGALTDIILADNRVAKIDARVLSTAPKANQQSGLNLVLNNAAKNLGEFPMVQARMRDIEGNYGFITIVANPTTREGNLLLSNMAGTVIDTDLLKGGEKDGQKLGAQYTPVALSTLDKMHTADAGTANTTLAALTPRQ